MVARENLTVLEMRTSAEHCDLIRANASASSQHPPLGSQAHLRCTSERRQTSSRHLRERWISSPPCNTTLVLVAQLDRQARLPDLRNGLVPLAIHVYHPTSSELLSQGVAEWLDPDAAQSIVLADVLYGSASEAQDQDSG